MKTKTMVSKKHCQFFLLIAALIFIRIPVLSLWNNYMTGNDAAIYLEKAIHLSEGKGLTSSICRFMPSRVELKEYIAKFGNRTQELKVAPLYIYCISGIYSITGENNFLLAINIFNLLLFTALLFLIFYLIVPLFTDNYKIGLMTVMLVGLNYTYFEGMFGAHLETLSLFLFICSYAWHARIVSRDKVKWWELLGYAILLSMLFLSKYSTIPFVGAFVLHHLILRKYSRFFPLALIVTALAGSWFILRDLLLEGKVISAIAQSPFVVRSSSLSLLDSIIHIVTRILRVAGRFAQILFSFEGLAFVLPFSVVYYAGHIHDRIKQANWLLLIISLIFFTVLGYIDPRYIYPVLVPLIPASLDLFRKFLKAYKPSVRRFAIIGLIAIFAGYQMHEIVFYTNAVRKQAPDRKAIFEAADEIIAEEGISEESVILTNILGYNVYTDVGVVKTPEGLTVENKDELIELYDIDYVLFCSDQLNTKLAWDQYGAIEDVFSDLKLIATSSKDGRLRLYSTGDKDL